MTLWACEPSLLVLKIIQETFLLDKDNFFIFKIYFIFLPVTLLHSNFYRNYPVNYLPKSPFLSLVQLLNIFLNNLLKLLMFFTISYFLGMVVCYNFVLIYRLYLLLGIHQSWTRFLILLIQNIIKDLWRLKFERVLKDHLLIFFWKFKVNLFIINNHLIPNHVQIFKN